MTRSSLFQPDSNKALGVPAQPILHSAAVMLSLENSTLDPGSCWAINLRRTCYAEHDYLCCTSLGTLGITCTVFAVGIVEASCILEFCDDAGIGIRGRKLRGFRPS